MRIVFHHEIPDDDGLRGQWNHLVGQMARAEVFYTYEWALALQRAYGKAASPLLALAYDNDSLVGIFCARRCHPLKLSFFAAETADYCDFVSAPNRRLEFINLILRELKIFGYRDLTLANLPLDSASTLALGCAAGEQKYSCFSRPAYRCAQIDLSSVDLRTSVRESVAQKQVVRRDLKAMSKLGPVELVHLRTWADISAALPAFEQAHIARFRHQGRISPLLHDERGTFLRELARLLAMQRWMTLSCLTLAGTPVAWNFGFEFRGSYFWYQPTFSESVAKYSPGSCLLAKVILEACEREDVRRIDLGLGDEGYKERFATSYRSTLQATVTSSSARYLKECLRYRAASAIKSAPRMESYIRRAMAHLSGSSSA